MAIDGHGVSIGEEMRAQSPCFAPGTAISTAQGAVSVEDLRPGMMVTTADDGPQPLRWVGVRSIDFRVEPERMAPVRIGRGAFGLRSDGTPLPSRDMIVSPMHHMVIDGPAVLDHCGQQQALAPAMALVGLPGIWALKGIRTITYFALLLDRHQVIYAEGAATESFRPTAHVLQDFGPHEQAEIATYFPNLQVDPPTGAPTPARPLLRVSAVRWILHDRRQRSLGPRSSG